jgi:hypothetical protein
MSVVLNVAGADQIDRSDFDGMQHRVDIPRPKIQKAMKLWIFGGQIQILPREALEKGGMVGQVIQDLSGRKAITAELLIKVGHVIVPPNPD